METVSVVIVEHGGNWLPWARKLRASRDRLVVVAQTECEAPHAFARRVIGRLKALRHEGVQLAEAALVGGTVSDSSHKHQRSKILRKLTALLSHCGCEGHLYLDPGAEVDQPSQNLMHAIAWALRDLTRGSGVSISVGLT
ncbi:MAG: hypothetical protein OXU20_32640 [Myxococcales bacterium]|nr:hypothetical protein [Myxococcales bacterium]